MHFRYVVIFAMRILMIKIEYVSLFLVVDEFQLHVDDVDVMLVDLLLVLQDLIARCKFTEF